MQRFVMDSKELAVPANQTRLRVVRAMQRLYSIEVKVDLPAFLFTCLCVTVACFTRSMCLSIDGRNLKM
jgi:hypothetical protein